MARKILDPNDVRHGKLSFYTNHGCRCVLCKRANSSAHLKRKYGITLEQKEDLLHAQGGLCAACQDFLPSDMSKLHLDHNHVTQEVRALLCSGCNSAFGLMGESARRIEGLLNYARIHGEV